MSVEARFHDAWRRLLLGRLDDARAQFADLVARLDRSNAKYAGKVLKVFFHPYVMGPELERRTVDAVEPLTELLEKVARLYLEQEDVRARFDFDPRVVELIRGGPTPSRAAPVLRYDSFVTDAGIRFVEANTDGSSGMNDTNVIEDSFLQTALAREIGGRFRLDMMPMHQPLLDAILDAYSKDPPELPGHPVKDPVVAIVDWEGVKTETEFFGLRDFFQQKGVRTLIVDPRRLVFDGKRLLAAGVEIDIVYKRVLTAELLARWDEVQPLIEGYRRRAYTQIGSYLGEVIYDKGILALLSDPACASWFTPEELELVRRHIPWTRRIETQNTDLMRRLRQDRARLVLKPANAYGGRGVRIGAETSETDWEQALQEAASGGFIVQEAVPIPAEEFVLMEEGVAVPKKVNIGQFLFGGRFAGLYCRVSDDSVINVSAGGATLPCFRVSEEPGTRLGGCEAATDGPSPRK